MAGRRLPDESWVGRAEGVFAGVTERDMLGVDWPGEGSPRSWCFVGADIVPGVNRLDSGQAIVIPRDSPQRRYYLNMNGMPVAKVLSLRLIWRSLADKVVFSRSQR